MGIPAFYRWLVERYPRAVVDVMEEASVSGFASIDTTGPNPNGTEFDNLYLDMNGIVHPCFHPEGLPAPKSYDNVFKAVFNYIDRIFFIVRPRKLVYLAIDGVAPRAKMNQQRTRRFRAAKDAADEASLLEKLGDSVGSEESTSLDHSSKLDSNIITPGTEFMLQLSSALRYYIQLRMNEDCGWRGIKVILSDANVPGEGEHKIMTYIRLQRNLPGFDPNTRHCLYGLDADLIMLALATHEIHFSVLREDLRNVRFNDNKISKYGSQSLLQVRETLQQLEGICESLEEKISRLKFQFLNIWVLREYLALDMKISDPKVNGDLERLIDDFVFMCLFVGNDFLPHMPSLEISEGAIDLLLTVYNREFIRMGGYLTNSSEVNLKRMQHFVQAVASYESAIFRKRVQMQKERDIRFRNSSNNIVKPISPNKLNIASDGHDSASPSVVETQSPMNRTSNLSITVVDKIKLGEDGWKERYYAEKFDAETEDDCERIRKNAVLKYVEGICWVMHYYYEGVCSWQWFYPYHYAPFASDFCGIDQFRIQFELGEPFKPLDQLMGVLPAASAHALPLFYRKLMTDPASPLSEFYPKDFELDMNGKRFSWQAICKLPFIEESRLLLEIASVEHTLTEEERQRNNVSLDVFFIHVTHPLAVKITSIARGSMDHLNLSDAKVELKIDPNLSGGMNGYVIISDEALRPEQIHAPTEGIETIADNAVLCLFYKGPSFHAHVPRTLKGAKMPENTIHKQDVLSPPVLWHDKSSIMGRLHSERPTRKSISGLCLAKSARQLLLKCYLTKELGNRGYMECVDNAGGSDVGKRLDKPTSVSNCIINHMGTERFIWDAHPMEKQSVGKDEVGGEKNIDGSRKRKRKRKHRKNEGISGPQAGGNIPHNMNSAFTDGIEVGSEKNERDRPLKKKQKPKKGNDTADQHLRTGEACSNFSAFTGGIEVGTEKNERTGPLKKKRYDTPDHYLRTGEACKVNSGEVIYAGAGKNEVKCGTKGEGSRKQRRKRKRGKNNGIPDPNVGTNLICNLNSACMGEDEVRIEKIGDRPLKKRRKRKQNKGNDTPDPHLRTGEASKLHSAGKDEGVCNTIGYVSPKQSLKQKLSQGNDIPGTVGAASDSNMGGITYAGKVECTSNIVEQSSKQRRKKKPKNKGNGTPDPHLRTGEASKLHSGNKISAVESKDEVLCDTIGYASPKQSPKEKLSQENDIPGTGAASDSNMGGIIYAGKVECVSNIVEQSSKRRRKKKPKKRNSTLDDHISAEGLACKLSGDEVDKCKHDSIGKPGSNGNCADEADLLDKIDCVNNIVEKSRNRRQKKKPKRGNGTQNDHISAEGLACKLSGTEVDKCEHDSIGRPGSNGNCADGADVLDNDVGVEVLASNTNLKEGTCKGEVQGKISVVEKSKKRRQKRKKGGLNNLGSN